MILTDNETKVDLLNYEAIALTITKLLRERPDKPVTIGVHGDWGAGKSSILEMIESGLKKEENVLCVKFNGWRFQGFEDAKIALIEGIVTGLVEKRPALKKATGALKETFKRIDWLKAAKTGGGLAWTAFTGIPTPDQIQAVVGTVKGLIGNPASLATKGNIESAMGQLDGLLKSAEAKHLPEEIQEFQKAFDDLLKEASVDQLVVLIDDLDRCLPEVAIETLEAVRLFVFTKRTAFVVAADEAMIEYAVRKHFPELPDTTGPRDYARNYLEKLIQVPFRIPALGETETRTYVTLLLIAAELGEDDPEFQKLIDAARQRLKKPWAVAAIDAATVRDTLGDKAASVLDALTLSDQIGTILATGTKGNPRQIKRFLNTLVLRQRIAEARGFGDDIKLPILAKLMLAERFFPPLFDSIAAMAAASADGKCRDLKVLEVNIEKQTDKKTSTKEESISAEAQGWISSEYIQSWAAVQPQLGDIDLRPYLFVAKDRKDYFGGNSALGKLVAVAEQLLGPKMTVQAMNSKLRELAPPETAQVFEEVRLRIMSKGSFDTQPPGIEGLRVLVTAHPELESNLMSFLESLPLDHLGPWVVQGWNAVIKDPANNVRFDQSLDRWASTSNNQPLKTAAAAAISTRRKK
ncbi:MAG: KAP P-loop [uncultured bacterium]|nr:MAG: KAP P-loop [uncultured bacterium]OGH14229.1 MAG: NTPase KAP [Candidatus Levybacteria bacterium RIFCSPHIGHO2_01_FULL_38_26]